MGCHDPEPHGAITQDRSPVREFRTPGSARGVRSNAHPYRDVRRETGKEYVVKVHCSEGVAIHTGPESCVDDPRGRGEALTGERIGQPLSRESLLRGADAVETAEGNMAGGDMASRPPTPRGLRPWHVRTLLAREPGDLVADHRQKPSGPHREGMEP